MKKLLTSKLLTLILIIAAVGFGVSTIILANKTADASTKATETAKAADSARKDLDSAKKTLAKAQADKKAADDAAAKKKTEEEAAAKKAAEELAALSRLPAGDCSGIVGTWAKPNDEKINIAADCSGSASTGNVEITFNGNTNQKNPVNLQVDGSYTGSINFDPSCTSGDDFICSLSQATFTVYPPNINLLAYSDDGSNFITVPSDTSITRIFIYLFQAPPGKQDVLNSTYVKVN